MSKRKSSGDELTPSGRFSVGVGEYGFRVRVREDRSGRVVLDYRDADGVRRTPYTEIRSVRDANGRLVPRLVAAVKAEGLAMSARVRLQKLRADAAPITLTLEDGLAIYHDPERGGLPRSKQARVHHSASRDFWISKLVGATPWNRIVPGDVLSAAMGLVRAGQVATAEKRVDNLRTVYRWLVKWRDIEGLKDPTRGIERKELNKGYTPSRPPFRPVELVRIVAVAHEVDPRFRLMVIMADDSGARSVALYAAWRSMIDAPVELVPSVEQAPYGWALLPALKGQDRALTFLTLRQRLELSRALWRRWNGVRFVDGYLADLERRYQTEAVDYPLFPGGPVSRSGVFDLGDYQPVSSKTVDSWLKDAQRRAGVPIVHRRGWHGIRRAWSNYTYEETDLDTLTDAGAWKDRDTPAEIYLSKQRLGRLAKSREAQERKGG